MAVPESVSNALNVLDSDQASLIASEQEASDKEQAALEAQHLSEVAQASVASATSQRDSDKAALLKLIDETYK